MAISKRLRFEILRRDNFACRYCGNSAPDAVLTVDHVTPTALGGKDEPANLVAACADCNGGKSSMPADAPIIDDVAQDALRWSRAVALAAEIAERATRQRAELNGEFQDLWAQYAQSYQREWPRPSDWPNHLDRFRDYGLPQAEIIDALWTALDKPSVSPSQRWKYFCGICWRKLDRIQEAAREILTTEDPGEGTV